MTLNNIQSSLAFRTPPGQSENPAFLPQKNILVLLQCFSLVCRRVVMASSVFSFRHLLVHHAVGLEDLFELSDTSDAPIHRIVRVTYFCCCCCCCCWSDTANLWNCDVRTRVKRGMTAYVHCDLLQYDVESEDCCDKIKIFSFYLKRSDRLGFFLLE